MVAPFLGLKAEFLGFGGFEFIEKPSRENQVGKPKGEMIPIPNKFNCSRQGFGSCGLVAGIDSKKPATELFYRKFAKPPPRSCWF